MNSSFGQRVERVRRRMIVEGLDAYMAVGAADCHYLTGFTGEAASVFVTGDRVILLTDPRFTVQARDQAPDVELLVFTGGQDDELPPIAAETGPAEGRAKARVGIDPAHMTVKRWDHLRPLLEDVGVEWSVAGGIVEGARSVKFPDEIDAIRASCALVTRAFEYLETHPVVGKTEREIALELEMLVRKEGSEGIAFPFIVAAGPRGAMPHAEASGAVIERDRLMVFDLGTVVGGYASDVTRTYATGPIDDELMRAYELTREAQAVAVAAARSGVVCRDLDAVARDHLASGGLAERFVHSLGHGVGLEVHESPNVSFRSETVLEPGMVITIEPGVYFPGRAGIRIEDTVVVGEAGVEVLTEWPRELRYLS